MQTTAIATSPAASPPVRYLRQPEVLARIHVSWITLKRWEALGKFPKRRQLGPNVVAWVEAEINEWCATRDAAVNPKAAVR